MSSENTGQFDLMRPKSLDILNKGVENKLKSHGGNAAGKAF
jgi:hypothetical protein